MGIQFSPPPADDSKYSIMAGSFLATPGGKYAADTSATETVTVLPTFEAGGLKFTGKTWDHSGEFYIAPFDDEPPTNLDGNTLSININSPGTLAEIIALFGPELPYTVELAEGSSPSDLFPTDLDDSFVFEGGSETETFIPFMVTIPEFLQPGDIILFKDAMGTWDDNPIVILCGGHLIEGQNTDFVNNAAGTSFDLLFVGGAKGFRVFTAGTKPLNLTPPEVSGTYLRSATAGTWTGSPTAFAYQWQRSDDGEGGWSNIEGATSSTYLPTTEDDEGKYLRVAVVATNANGPSAAAYSQASGPVVIPEFPADGLIAFWRLDDLTDASGAGNTLTNTGSVTFDTGHLGDAAVFSTGKYLGAPVGIGGDVQEFSISAWFKTSQTGNTNRFIVGNEAEDTDYLMIMEHGGGVYANLRGASQIGGGGGTYNDNEWHHAVLTYDGSTLKLFIDGTLFDSAANVGVIAPTPLYIGANQTGSHGFGGSGTAHIDAVGLWDRALINEEIALLYAEGEGKEP
ncbi:MAG: LamG domain-containing protein [Chthoniobacterales bacterium]|nr:LamG domain-containing protein [Chthoniobacterales bacterium]